LAKTSFFKVDDYLAAQPDDARAALERVRTIIRKAIPRAEEVISYQIPAYKLDGRTTVFFAGWKEHFSIYPATSLVVSSLKRELAPYKISKGTIRFPLSERVPAALIARVAKLRAKEVTEQARAKPKGKKAPTRRHPAKVRKPSGARRRSK
jgi:uncharacterized protein YdhG (YjbR/CyaY superfamily)